MAGPTIQISGKILPYFKRININEMKLNAPGKHEELQYVANKLKYKGPENFSNAIALYNISKNQYFPDNNSRNGLNNSQTSILIKYNHQQSMLFDENVNQALGKYNVFTYWNEADDKVWFCGLKMPIDSFSPGYLKNHFKDEKTKDDFYSIDPYAYNFGRLLQILRNPTININAYSLTEPHKLLMSDLKTSLPLQAIKQIADTAWTTSPAILRDRYLGLFNDTVTDDEVAQIDSITQRSLLQLEMNIKRENR